MAKDVLVAGLGVNIANHRFPKLIQVFQTKLVFPRPPSTPLTSLLFVIRIMSQQISKEIDINGNP